MEAVAWWWEAARGVVDDVSAGMAHRASEHGGGLLHVSEHLGQIELIHRDAMKAHLPQ